MSLSQAAACSVGRVEVGELGLPERVPVRLDVTDGLAAALVAQDHARGLGRRGLRAERARQVHGRRLHVEVRGALVQHPVVHPCDAVLEHVSLGVRPVHAVDEHEPLGDRVRELVEHVRRAARAGLLVLVGRGDVHRNVDAVHVVDQRARLEPVAVRVVEAVDQRVLEERAAALGLVGRALRRSCPRPGTGRRRSRRRRRTRRGSRRSTAAGSRSW